MPRKLVSGISRAPVCLAAPPVDLGLDRPHLLVGDDEEIAGAAGRVEHPDPRHALAQVQQHAGIVAGLLKLRAQVVEEQRIEHFQDVRHAGVVHAERAAFLVLRDRLDHRAEDVRVDLCPVEAADVEQVGARDPAEARHVHAAGEQPAIHVGKDSAQRGSFAARAILRPWCSWRGTVRRSPHGCWTNPSRSSARSWR